MRKISPALIRAAKRLPNTPGRVQNAGQKAKSSKAQASTKAGAVTTSAMPNSTFERVKSSALSGLATLTGTRTRQSTAAAKAGLGLMGRIRKAVVNTTTVALLSLAILAPGFAQAHTMNLAPASRGPVATMVVKAPQNALNARLGAMTSKTASFVSQTQVTAQDVDFRVTDTENLNHGEVTFKIEHQDAARLADAINGGEGATLLAPWGTGGGLGSKVTARVEDGQLVLSANAYGSALLKTEANPVVLIQRDGVNQSLSIGFSSVDTNFNALYHGQSARSLKRHEGIRDQLVKDFQAFERGETPEQFDYDSAAPYQEMIKDMDGIIQNAQKNLSRDFIDTAVRNHK